MGGGLLVIGWHTLEGKSSVLVLELLDFLFHLGQVLVGGALFLVSDFELLRYILQLGLE